MGYFDRKFYVEGDVAANHYWCQKTRMFGLPHNEDGMILSSSAMSTSCKEVVKLKYFFQLKCLVKLLIELFLKIS